MLKIEFEDCSGCPHFIYENKPDEGAFGLCWHNKMVDYSIQLSKYFPFVETDQLYKFAQRYGHDPLDVPKNCPLIKSNTVKRKEVSLSAWGET